jgi:lysozyme inhibitor LprI
MQDCVDNEWKKSDAELNRVYQESLKKLKPEQAALLKKRNAPGSLIATPSAKPATKCSQVAPSLL